MNAVLQHYGKLAKIEKQTLSSCQPSLESFGRSRRDRLATKGRVQRARLDPQLPGQDTRGQREALRRGRAGGRSQSG
jgi:hypothetical protein